MVQWLEKRKKYISSYTLNIKCIYYTVFYTKIKFPYFISFSIDPKTENFESSDFSSPEPAFSFPTQTHPIRRKTPPSPASI